MTIAFQSMREIIPEATSKWGLLNSQALPNGITAIYLQDKLYKITNKTGVEDIACVISALNNLQNEPTTTLQNLKEEKRIGALYVQDGKIQSLTLMPEQIQMMQENQVNEVAFKVDQTLLRIKDRFALRSYTSEKEYQQFTNLIR